MSDELESLLGELGLNEPKDLDSDDDVKQEDTPTIGDPIDNKPLVNDQPADVYDSCQSVSVRDEIISDVQRLPSPSMGVDVFAIIDKHSQDYDAISENIKRDRSKIDSVFRILLAKVDSGTAKGTEIEALTRVLQTLADTNGHAVRLLSTKTQLLSSTKSAASTIIQNNNGGGDDRELSVILQQSVDDED